MLLSVHSTLYKCVLIRTNKNATDFWMFVLQANSDLCWVACKCVHWSLSLSLSLSLAICWCGDCKQAGWKVDMHFDDRLFFPYCWFPRLFPKLFSHLGILELAAKLSLEATSLNRCVPRSVESNCYKISLLFSVLQLFFHYFQFLPLKWGCPKPFLLLQSS